MLVVESSMAGGRHETAIAAVSLLTAVLTVRSDSLSWKTAPALRLRHRTARTALFVQHSFAQHSSYSTLECWVVPPQAHAATDAISQAMWKRALRALGVGVEAAVSPQCCVPLQVGLHLPPQPGASPPTCCRL